MNKKGFTLVELLAVIVLIAILSGIAVPNIMSSINNSKKNTFLLDAKRMVSKAEYLLSKDTVNRNKLKRGEVTNIIYNFNDLNNNGEFQTDADGGIFDNTSFVKISINGSNYESCICVIGSKRRIGDTNSCDATTGDGCILSNTLTGIDKVKDK